jgi:hypothetical protein
MPARVAAALSPREVGELGEDHEPVVGVDIHLLLFPTCVCVNVLDVQVLVFLKARKKAHSRRPQAYVNEDKGIVVRARHTKTESQNAAPSLYAPPPAPSALVEGPA